MTRVVIVVAAVVVVAVAAIAFMPLAGGLDPFDVLGIIRVK